MLSRGRPRDQEVEYLHNKLEEYEATIADLQVWAGGGGGAVPRGGGGSDGPFLAPSFANLFLKPIFSPPELDGQPFLKCASQASDIIHVVEHVLAWSWCSDNREGSWVSSLFTGWASCPHAFQWVRSPL